MDMLNFTCSPCLFELCFLSSIRSIIENIFLAFKECILRFAISDVAAIKMFYVSMNTILSVFRHKECVHAHDHSSHGSYLKSRVRTSDGKGHTYNQRRAKKVLLMGEEILAN